MRLQDVFERTYVINLPTRVDRRRRVTSELEWIGSPLEPGKIDIFPAIRPTEADGFASIGMRGCMLSHLAVLRQARQDKLANVLVIEDDLVIRRPSWPHAAHLLKTLPQQRWDIAYLGHFEKSQAPEPGWSELKYGIIGLHLYAVNGPLLDRLVDYLEEVPKRPPGDPLGARITPDGAVSLFRHFNPDVMTIMANPSLGHQGSSPSDLQPPHWYDQIPVLRSAAAFARSIKSAIKHR